MSLVINTNIASLTAQRNLNGSQSSLQVSLQRLSSGLRINSAKDDAAGMAISNRMTAQIRGLNQASRNANDGISLSQTAEGAMQEMTNILQRVRELAIQSANSSNSASDRSSLQSEVNQLKSELTRVANTTTFNGQKLLDGSLTNASFQIGSEANQTISVSISDVRSTALGSNTVTTDNTTNGLAVATSTTRVQYDGAEVGAAQQLAAYGAALNGLTGETLTVKDADGSTVSTATVSAGEQASATATDLNAIDGVTATAYNELKLLTWTADADAGDSGDSVTFTVNSGAASSALVLSGVTATSTESQIFSALRDAINADSTLSGAGLVASIDGSSDLVLRNSDGDDIAVAVATADTTGTNDAGFTAQGLDGATTITATANTATDTVQSSGILNIYLAAGYTIESSAANQLFTEAANTVVTVDESNVAIADVTDSTSNAANFGNRVAAQVLTIVGPNGSGTATIGVNSTAAAVANAVNAESSTTGVTAEATTSASLGSLSADGTVTFSLFGSNTTAANISATVTTGDLTSLAKAINDQTGTTGVTATLTGSNNGISLALTTGENIQITDFTHSAAAGPSSSDIDGTETSMTVTGGGGSAVTLYDGGNLRGDQDSTVVGGTVTFRSSGSFNITSDASSTISGGNVTVFDVDTGEANTSTLSAIDNVDISNQTGANDAISVVDGALSQIDEIRSSLGAIQNRFETTISNLNTISENLSAARSRIMDTDFALETASLTRAQIAQQAGIAMLSQANSLPQLVLSLLQ
ncbi:MAG TPA: flagellin domain-containing protein [Gammaproteobacteria bacterium]|nr:flagellin domain-containing protein [Gammaproteobacteria bacterium]